jgi:quercetin dioxygenase-like cupin family protein
MSSLDRPLAGKPLRFRLGTDAPSDLIDEGALARSGRTARTLIKEGPLRVTLVALAPGGVLAEHQASGPISVQVLSGQIRFRVGEEEWMLEEGDLLSLGAAISHSVDAEQRSVFLLTMAALE